MDDQVRMKHSSARNPAIELFRCVMMLGVVAIHVFGGMGARWWWLSYALLFCVDGFVFISGYYGIHFRVGKLFRLYCVIFYCSFISVAVQYLGGRALTGGYFLSVYEHFYQRWFIHAYVLLMCFSPLIETVMSNLEKTRWAWVRVFTPLLIVAFGWSFLASYNCTIGVIPRSPGLESFSALTLIGVYIVARLCRHYNVVERISLKTAVIVAVIVIPLGAFRASIYNSPFCVVAAMCVFLIFTKIRIPSILARAGAFLAPSMFSVYLIHTSSFATGHIIEWQQKIGCHVGNEGLSLCVLIFIIWVGGLLLDLPRRAVVNFLGKRYGGKKYRVA